MELIKDQSFLKKLPLIRSFHNAYTEPNRVNRTAVLTEEKITHPDSMPLITLRGYIENSQNLGSGQKYVIGFRSYSFGDMATIDLISLDRKNHRDIASEHVRRMEWPLAENVSGSEKFESTYHSPFAVTGGHLGVADNGLLRFHGDSSDYTDYFLWSKANHVASFIAETLGLAVENNTRPGKQFMQKLLSFLQDHKLSDDFYEELAAKSFTDGERVTGQQLSAMVTMKSADRVLEEDGDFVSILVNELTGEFSSKVMAANAARQLRDQ